MDGCKRTHPCIWRMQHRADGMHWHGGTECGRINNRCCAKDYRESGKRAIPSILKYHATVLQTRKDIMMLRSDVFVALPGGIGTLDELFTVAASATIGYHKKKVILYNMEGFWNQLINASRRFTGARLHTRQLSELHSNSQQPTRIGRTD